MLQSFIFYLFSLLVTLQCSNAEELDTASHTPITWHYLEMGYPGRASVVYWDEGQINIFLRGANNKVYLKKQFVKNGVFSNPKVTEENLEGNNIVSDVAAVKSDQHQIDIFAISEDGKLWNRRFNGARWDHWETIGESFTGNVAAVSWTYGRVDIFARGRDGAIHHKSRTGVFWSNWESLGGKASGNPQVVSRGDRSLDVFHVSTNQYVYHRSFDGNQWLPKQGWEYIGIKTDQDVAAVSVTPSTLDVFVRGSDSTVYHRSWNKSWSKYWVTLGGRTKYAPAAVAWYGAYITVAIQEDYGVQLKKFNGQAWYDWNGIRNGNTVGRQPLLISPPKVDNPAEAYIPVFVTEVDNSLWVYEKQ